MELCGWTFGNETSSMPLIDKLESEHEYVRAALLSIFTLRMMRAIELLAKGGQKQKELAIGMEADLNMAAMALSGYTGKEGGLWTTICTGLSSSLGNPYLKGLFRFLTSEDIGYESIVYDPQLELCDRLAFACMHLSDKKLTPFLEKQSAQLIDEGNPVGLVLTGLTESGIQLLSNYVDKTGDVQSAVAIIIQGQPELNLSQNKIVMDWIKTYKDLLDNMKLWTERAEFDVFYHKLVQSTDTVKQTYLCCTYCSRPTVTIPKAAKVKGNTHLETHMKPRTQSCPYCRKPLARCCICMLHMGTASGIGCPKSAKTNLKLDRKLSRISEWFSWCQTCQHGGHVEHMIAWFKARNRCPVSGCRCKCEYIDPTSKIESKSYNEESAIASVDRVTELVTNRSMTTATVDR